jgi:non-heme chloroperoxidase
LMLDSMTILGALPMPTTLPDPSGPTLSYSDTGGEGRPVVLIHGWPLDRRSWNANVPALSSGGFRVIAYDRRGFGESEKTNDSYDYDFLADDLRRLITELDLRDVTLVGFSMGGGEVARYVARFGEDRIRSVVFASAVPPFLLHSEDNPEGPLTEEAASEMEKGLRDDRLVFFDTFTTKFFSVGDELKVSEAQRQEAIAQCQASGIDAALACMQAFATTDFREDLKSITAPTLVIHGDGDGTVPFEGSGKRTFEIVAHSVLHVIEGGPHGINVANSEEFNQALLEFLEK